MPNSASRPGARTSEIRVHYALVPEDASRLMDRFDWLQPDERARHARFRLDDDRRAFLAGRVMVRALAGAALGVPPAVPRFVEGPHGRPEIADPASAWRFNLAHSGGLVACVVGAGREIGVDVEDLERHAISQALIDRACAFAEQIDIHGRPPEARSRRFLRYWTLKEAYLKARGLGISVHLGDIVFTPDDERPGVSFRGSLAGGDTRWVFHLAQPTARHLIAVAADTRDGAAPAIAMGPFDLAS